MANSLHTWLASGSISQRLPAKPNSSTRIHAMTDSFTAKKAGNILPPLEESTGGSGKDCELTISISDAQISLLWQRSLYRYMHTCASSWAKLPSACDKNSGEPVFIHSVEFSTNCGKNTWLKAHKALKLCWKCWLVGLSLIFLWNHWVRAYAVSIMLWVILLCIPEHFSGMGQPSLPFSPIDTLNRSHHCGLKSPLLPFNQ